MDELKDTIIDVTTGFGKENNVSVMYSFNRFGYKTRTAELFVLKLWKEQLEPRFGENSDNPIMSVTIEESIFDPGKPAVKYINCSGKFASGLTAEFYNAGATIRESTIELFGGPGDEFYSNKYVGKAGNERFESKNAEYERIRHLPIPEGSSTQEKY